MSRLSRTRRDVLKALAAAGSLTALPDSIQKALAVPAHQRTGTLKDVEHIVILTQENRSFDHCFGTLRGVRGFGDPRVMKLASGQSVWHQPSDAGDVLPFRPSVDHLGAGYLPDPAHGWNDGHAAWHDGRFDRWIANKGIVSMAHNVRSVLADGTDRPQPLHMWSGWVGNDGAGGGPVITNAEEGYSWKTFPERMRRWH
jgi:phospholipase C